MAETDAAQPQPIPPPAPAKAPAAAPTQPTPEVAQPDAFDRAASEWLDRFVRNSPISLATEAWNHLQKVLPELKALLKKET